MQTGIFGGVIIPTKLVFIGGIGRGIKLFNNHILPNIIDKNIMNDKDAICNC